MAKSDPATPNPLVDKVTTDGTAAGAVPPVTEPISEPPTAPVHPEGNRGQTLLRTKVGYQYDSGVDDLPVITSGGVYVTAAQADEILSNPASNDVVYKDTKEGE